MPFNSDTYHANRARVRAIAYLMEARRLKASWQYDWQLARVPTFVGLARLEWRIWMCSQRMGHGKRRKWTSRLTP